MNRILLAGAILLVAGCGTATEWRYPPQPAEDAIRIYIVKHGWHTGVVVPNTGAQSPFVLLDPLFGKAAFYEFGWGDREYYPSSDPGLWLALRAGLWPTSSVLHVVALSAPPSVSFPNAEMAELLLSPEGYRALLNYLSRHIVLDGQSHPAIVGPGLYGNSRFFASHRTFHVLRNCNTWTAQALRAGGAPIHPFLALTAGNVLYQVRKAMQDIK